MKLSAKGELVLESGEAIRVRMFDAATGEYPNATIKMSPSGQILVAVDGYGDCSSRNGEGHPILIEKWDGVLRVVCWKDINFQDVTDIVNLEGAKEEKRITSAG
jgi:hypothetical protein